MKWNPSKMHWMGHMHMPHTQALHMHPVHWFHAHPMAQALLLAGLIALLVYGLIAIVNSGVGPDAIRPLDYPVAYPYGPFI